MKKKSYFFHRNIGRTHKKDQNKQSYEILRDLRFIGILHIIYWSDPYDPGVDKPEQVHFKKVSSAMFLWKENPASPVHATKTVPC